MIDNTTNQLVVHLVDDDKTLLRALAQVYELDGLLVRKYSDSRELIKHVDESFAGVIVSDVRMPHLDGFALFDLIRKIDPEIPMIFVTGHADVPMVLELLRNGAFEMFTKPVEAEHLVRSTRRALESRRLVLENRELRLLAERAEDNSNLVGETAVMIRLRESVRQIAQTDVDVLLEGETGTGKELIAGILHKLSARSDQELLRINCAGLLRDDSDTDMWHTLKLTLSDNGQPYMLFLDEVESLPTGPQGQLSSILESNLQEDSDAGARAMKSIRIVASSQVDLLERVNDGLFRPDLFYRLNTVHLRVPPLRERAEDVPLLFAHFLSQASTHYSRKIPRISMSARQRLLDYDWPGNVRELKNFATSIILGLDASSAKTIGSSLTLPQRVERFEETTIRCALAQTGGDVRSTLELLSIPRKTFYDKISRHKIDLKKYRN